MVSFSDPICPEINLKGWVYLRLHSTTLTYRRGRHSLGGEYSQADQLIARLVPLHPRTQPLNPRVGRNKSVQIDTHGFVLVVGLETYLNERRKDGNDRSKTTSSDFRRGGLKAAPNSLVDLGVASILPFNSHFQY